MIASGARTLPAAFVAAQRLEDAPFLGDTWFYRTLSSLGQDTRDIGGIVARAQTGLLRTYALAIASSVAVLAVVFVAVR